MFFKKHRAVRLTAVLSASLLLLSAPAGLSALPVYAADSLSDLQQQSKDLKEEANRLQQQISEQEKNLTDQKAYKATLDQKIENAIAQVDLYENQISTLNGNIASLNDKITAKETAIAEKEADIAERFEELRQRLRAISKSGNMTALQMLLDTGDYTDYLIKSKMMETVAKNDQQLMEELETEIQAIDAEKEALAGDKESVESQLSQAESLKKEADAQKAELDLLYAKANKAVQDIQNTLGDYQTSLKNTKAQWDALEKKITEIINASNSGGKYGGGTMAWPVPAVRNISSGFGPRWGTMHRGVDIANGSVPIYGQNIVAAADGVVIYANYSGWGGGYGLHLIVDHGVDAKGRKISTLYAHCSKVNVSVGQQVKRGETVLAKAGASGDVTGPHLHFEVRVNGTAVDPIKNGYLKVN